MQQLHFWTQETFQVPYAIKRGECNINSFVAQATHFSRPSFLVCLYIVTCPNETESPLSAKGSYKLYFG